MPDAGDVARMQRIINRLRSYGVVVREMPGWQTRGFTFPAVPTRVVDHHDASTRKSGEWGALGLILDGTPRGIPGPLANAQVGRCLDNIPKIAIVGAGYAYHAGLGGPYAELSLNNANPHTYGVEKANDGLGEPYTAAANYATNALFHAMAVESGRIPESFPIGHKEWAPGRKSDPLYSMPDRRRQVGAFRPTTATEDDMPTAEELWKYKISKGLETPTEASQVLVDARQIARRAEEEGKAANRAVAALAVEVAALKAAQTPQP